MPYTVPFGKPQLTGQLGHPEPSRAPGKQPQNRGRALDGLDAPGHV